MDKKVLLYCSVKYCIRIAVYRHHGLQIVLCKQCAEKLNELKTGRKNKNLTLIK